MTSPGEQPQRFLMEQFLKYGAPWILYACGAFLDHRAIGSASAFILLSVVCLKYPKRTKSIEIVLLVFFFLVCMGRASGHFSWLITFEPYLASSLLALMAFGSLLIDSPFTLAFAREFAPVSAWSDPHFLRVNRILTVLWGIAFLSCALLKYWSGFSNTMTLMIQVFLMLLVSMFTKWFPEWYQFKYLATKHNIGNPGRPA